MEYLQIIQREGKKVVGVGRERERETDRQTGRLSVREKANR